MEGEFMVVSVGSGYFAMKLRYENSVCQVVE